MEYSSESASGGGRGFRWHDSTWIVESPVASADDIRLRPVGERNLPVRLRELVSHWSPDALSVSESEPRPTPNVFSARVEET